MYPEQQPSQPAQQQPQPEQRPPYQPPVAEQPPVATPKKSLKLPIILMVWPAATIIAMMLLYVIVNAIIQDPPADSEVFGDTNPIKTIVNIASFGLGGLAAVLGPISFIVGLVLLIQRKSKR
jgi:hypothetical protein